MEPSGFLDRPDYRVDLLPRRNKVTVRIAGQTLAETVASILVDEQDHGLVFYFPEADVRLDLLVATDDQSRCPYKGQASYWRLAGGSEPIAWGYLDPYPQVARLRGFIGFYQDRVQVEVGVATPAVVGYSQ